LIKRPILNVDKEGGKLAPFKYLEGQVSNKNISIVFHNRRASFSLVEFNGSGRLTVSDNDSDYRNGYRH